MYVESCPYCGRKPKIRECYVTEDGRRRRIIGCPNYCWVLKPQDNGYWDLRIRFYIVWTGDGDDNMLYKKWNASIDKENNNA